MSEEKNRNTELNEAALVGVSGGGYGIASAMKDAGYKCVPCYTSNPARRECYREHWADLAHYLVEHGQNSVPGYAMCPYYKS